MERVYDFKTTRNNNLMKIGKEWLSISDMMSGLMMIFLFIGVSLMMEVQKKEIIVQDIKADLDKDLNQKFANKFKEWGISEVKDNIFRFNAPDVNFEINQDVVTDKFKAILSEFFPQYIEVLTSKKYKNYIKEIRIEGHTDSGYSLAFNKNEGYIYNIDLSQRRSKNVLLFLTELETFQTNEAFMTQKIRVNGFGSSVPVLDENTSKENFILSRRVDFRVIIANVSEQNQTLP